MSLTTRFGPDPLLDLEIANKQYVDAGSGGASQTIFMCNYWENLGAGNNFYALNNTHQKQTTEQERAVLSPIASTASLFCVELFANTSSSIETFAFRINESSVITMDIPVSTSGFFQNTVDTAAIAVEDLVNFLFTETAGSITLQSAGIVCTI